MITIVAYRTSWRAEFETIGRKLRDVLYGLALRIDHIGSTSVPGLAAKDIIDIQVTVAKLESPVEKALDRAGFQRKIDIVQDHRPPLGSEHVDDWTKWFFKPAMNQRPINLHVRCLGRANQRYPLLFRDYLRSHAAVAEGYAQVKLALAQRHANDANAYYDVKDPVCDIIMGGAEEWARQMNWTQPPSDC